MSPSSSRRPRNPRPDDATLPGRTVRVERVEATVSHGHVPAAAPLRQPDVTQAGFRRPVNGQATRRMPRGRRSHGRSRWPALALLMVAGVVMVGVMALLALLAGTGIVYSGGILPGVSAAGVGLGGLDRDEAAALLSARWASVTLVDDSQQPARTWTIDRAALGIELDAAATAVRAYEQGRGEGRMLAALLGRVDVAPVVRIDADMLANSLETLKPQVDIAPADAGVRLVSGDVQPVPPRAGYALDVGATVARLLADPAATLTDGSLELVMIPVQPAFSDSTPLLPLAALWCLIEFLRLRGALRRRHQGGEDEKVAPGRQRIAPTVSQPTR